MRDYHQIQILDNPVRPSPVLVTISSHRHRSIRALQDQQHFGAYALYSGIQHRRNAIRVHNYCTHKHSEHVRTLLRYLTK